MEIRPGQLSYRVNFEGKAVIRGRALLKPVSVECGSGQDQGQDDQLSQVEEGDLFPNSHSNHFPRLSNGIQEREVKWSSLPAPVPTVKGTLPSYESSKGCNKCIASRPRTPKIQSTSPQGDFPSSTYSGHGLPQFLHLCMTNQ